MDLAKSEIPIILKSILVTRAKTGALIEEILNDYKDLVGKSIDKNELREYLNRSDDIYLNYDRNNCPKYHVDTKDSKHIIEMVKQQKPEKRSGRRNQKMYNTTTKSNNAKKTIPYNYNKSQKKVNAATYNSSSEKNTCYYQNNNTAYNNAYNNINYYNDGAYLHNFQLVGDDFFLQMAIQELGIQLTPGCRVQRRGLCISGQTIKDLTHRIKSSTSNLDGNIILNIGSVDILHGRELFDIVSDFIDLIQTLYVRGITPIVTTLPPLANLLYSSESKRKLWKFNQFIRNSQKYVIDLYVCMVDFNDSVLPQCYQPLQQYVSGSDVPHVLWSAIANRRLVLAIALFLLRTTDIGEFVLNLLRLKAGEY